MSNSPGPTEAQLLEAVAARKRRRRQLRLRALESGRLKITAAVARNIRDAYATGDFTQSQIAAQFNINISAVSRILRGTLFPDRT